MNGDLGSTIRKVYEDEFLKGTLRQHQQFEKIALDLGFKDDKYYTAEDKMWHSCIGASHKSLGEVS